MRPPNEMCYNKNVKTAFIASESSRSTEHFSPPFLPSVCHSYCINNTVEFFCCSRFLVLLIFFSLLLEYFAESYSSKQCSKMSNLLLSLHARLFASFFFSFNSISLAEVISSARFRGNEMILRKIHQIAIGFMHLLLFSFQSFAVVCRRATRLSQSTAAASPYSLLLNSFASSFIHTLLYNIAQKGKMYFIEKFIDNVSKMIFPRLTNINK